MKCRLYAYYLYSLSAFMRTLCRLFSDLMHTNTVLCRPFAEIVPTWSRVNMFHSIAAARPAGARLEGEGGDSAMTAFEGEAQ